MLHSDKDAIQAIVRELPKAAWSESVASVIVSSVSQG
jgi:hypothetical protein